MPGRSRQPRSDSFAPVDTVWADRCHPTTTSPRADRLRTVLAGALAALLCFVTSAERPRAQSLTDAGHEHYQRTIERWIGAWRANRVDWRDPAVRAGDIHPLFENLVDPEGGQLDHFGALRLFLDELPRHDQAETLRVVLRLAAFGLGGAANGKREGTALIREAALNALSKVRSGRALDLLWRVAEGSVDRTTNAEQRAALLALGRRGEGAARIVLERALDEKDPRTRLAASLGLARHAHKNSLRRISARLLREDDALVARSLIDAVRTIAERHRDENGGIALPSGSAETALFVAQERLGQLGIEVDQAILELCATLRSIRSIPFLIDHLEQQDAESRPDGTRARAGEILRELTGALYQADEVAAWRRFWEKERDGFQLAPVRRPGVGRTQTGFFGIEVRGARVAFVIDLSGSMAASHASIGNRTSSERGALATRLECAVHELRRAVDTMAPDTQFEILTFSSRAKRVFGRLIPADQRGRERVRTVTAKFEAEGATNLWDALDGALDLRHPIWGKARPRRFDEVFVLSDGEPSAGDLTDPDLILAAVRESNRFQNVRIHTISLNPSGSPLMLELAEQNGGRYVPVQR